MSDEERNEISESIDKLEEKREYLNNWIDNFHSGEDSAPFVIMIRDLTDWQLEALRNRPEEAIEIKLNVTPEQFDLENRYIESMFPQPYNYNLVLAMNSTAVTTSGTSDVYQYIGRVGDIGTEDALKYANEYKTRYLKLQEQQNRPKQVRELIKKLDSHNTLERFDSAYNAYMEYKLNPEKRTAAAGVMRTLLDGVKGDLFNRARGWAKEDMTWETMSTRLASGGEGSFAHEKLNKLEEERTSLIERLSNVLKDRESGSVTNLADIWVQLLDHIYIVLGLIDFDEEIPK